MSTGAVHLQRTGNRRGCGLYIFIIFGFHKCASVMGLCTHLSLILSASSPHKSPCKSQSSDYNAGHVLIQTGVTNGCATAWWQALEWLPLMALHAPYNGVNESFRRGIHPTLHGYLWWAAADGRRQNRKMHKQGQQPSKHFCERERKLERNWASGCWESNFC